MSLLNLTITCVIKPDGEIVAPPNYDFSNSKVYHHRFANEKIVKISSINAHQYNSRTQVQFSNDYDGSITKVLIRERIGEVTKELIKRGKDKKSEIVNKNFFNYFQLSPFGNISITPSQKLLDALKEFRLGKGK